MSTPSTPKRRPFKFRHLNSLRSSSSISIFDGDDLISKAEIESFKKEPLKIQFFSKDFQNPNYNDYMEDVILTNENFCNNNKTHLFGIFDGHGSDKSAIYCKENFPKHLDKLLSVKHSKFDPNRATIEENFIKAFKDIDEEIKKMDYIDFGNTATIVYITDKTWYCAKVGDSKCILISKRNFKRLSYEDKCIDENEKIRIINAGGEITKKKLNGILSVSRAMGDFFLKDFGLISEPHITKIEINYDDKFCIIASDGIWDVITEEMVFNMSKKVESAEDLANKILKLALTLGSQDNISIVVIGFNLKNENVNKDI